MRLHLQFQFIIHLFLSLSCVQVEWGTKDYTKYERGTLPIILTSPHGGSQTDASIPDRDCSSCTTVTDSYTIQLTESIADSLFDLTGKRPHIIISYLSRKKLDPNREIGEAALGNPLAETVYYDFHGFITKARSYITQECKEGILFDIHGQSHSEGWIEFGYLLTSVQLRLSDAEILSLASSSSIRSISSARSNYFPDLLRGGKSIGGLMEAKTYKSVPSPEYPGPGTGQYFSGGYITQVHGSETNGTIDAIQIESPRDVRFNENGRNREVYARDLATSILEFYETFYTTSAASACK